MGGYGVTFGLHVQVDTGAVATGIADGKGSSGVRAVNDSPRTTPRWLEQLVAWMEERSLCIVGTENMPGSVPGDVPLVDMGENAEERAVLRVAVRANGRVWLSQILSEQY